MHSEQIVTTRAQPPADIDDTSVMLRINPSFKCHVLLVDDDDLVRARLTALLTLAGYEVYPARSGTEALAILATTPCQMVLTDWQMPDMDGLDLCRALRLRDKEGYIYVLLLTVRGTSADVVRGLAAGADDYVIKGACAEEILARLAVGKRITQLEHLLRSSNSENHRLSVTDPLTGARNRRYLMKYLPRELERARRREQPLAILGCDIDGFKRVNDDFGHDAGDDVLRAFVERTMGCLRLTRDWVARSGGEEFVVVLPETTLSGASIVADKLLANFSGRPIPTHAGPVSVTVSIGATAIETPRERENISVHDLLRAADRFLYASKALGKDRVTVAPAECAVVELSALPARATNEIN